MEDALAFQEDVHQAINTLIGVLCTTGKVESYLEEYEEVNQKYIIDVAFNEGSPASIRITLNVDPD